MVDQKLQQLYEKEQQLNEEDRTLVRVNQPQSYHYDLITTKTGSRAYANFASSTMMDFHQQADLVWYAPIKKNEACVEEMVLNRDNIISACMDYGEHFQNFRKLLICFVRHIVFVNQVFF